MRYRLNRMFVGELYQYIGNKNTKIREILCIKESNDTVYDVINKMYYNYYDFDNYKRLPNGNIYIRDVYKDIPFKIVFTRNGLLEYADNLITLGYDIHIKEKSRVKLKK